MRRARSLNALISSTRARRSWIEAIRCSGYRGSGRGSVIAGGESGPGVRPCDPDWLRDLRDQCRGAGAAFFLKQLGAVAGRQAGCRDAKGADLEAWPFDLRIREMPGTGGG